jgi:hypothetical protein
MYWVIHSTHRLSDQVILIQGNSFPRCSKCSDAVEFVFIRAVQPEFRDESVHLYELPVIEEDDSAKAQAG